MRTYRLLLALFALAMLPGCFAAPLALGAAGGVATFKVLENQEVRAYEAPFEAVFDATLAALRELDYAAPAFTTQGRTEATFRVDDAAIALAQFPEGKVRVAIRIGTFDSADHRRRAALLHEAIGRGVGPVPAPVPAS